VGVDFIVEKETQQVYALEMNPRFTGALPMLSLLHMDRQRIPMEVFHILEFLDLPYRIDVVALNAAYAKPITGSHLLLFLLSGDNMLAAPPIKAGLYDVGSEGIYFLREASEYQDIEKESQFVIVDGPGETNGVKFAPEDSLFRLCRVLFRTPVINRAGHLTAPARKAADWVHGALTKRKRTSSPAGKHPGRPAEDHLRP
jgi:hypothetical protein